MNFIEKIDALLEKNKMNRRQFSNLSHIPYTTISNWYQRGYDKLTLAAFEDVCNFFGVTMDSMAYDDREIEYIADRRADPLTIDEQQLLKFYSWCDERGKNTVMDAARREASYAREEKRDASVA